MPTPRSFSLGALLTCVSGITVSNKAFWEMLEMLAYLHQESPATSVLGPMARQATPVLLARFPCLGGLATEMELLDVAKAMPDCDADWDAWYQAKVAEYGEYFELTPL